MVGCSGGYLGAGAHGGGGGLGGGEGGMGITHHLSQVAFILIHDRFVEMQQDKTYII